MLYVWVFAGWATVVAVVALFVMLRDRRRRTRDRRVGTLDGRRFTESTFVDAFVGSPTMLGITRPGPASRAR